MGKSISAMLAIAGIAAAAYSAGLGGPLLFDDFYNLIPVGNWIKGLNSWQSVLWGNTSGLFGRPVAMATFLMNIVAFGDSVYAMKAVNVGFHVVTSAAVFILFTQLASATHHQKAPRITFWLPLLGAAIWALHPLLVSTVLYVIQRMAILSALFTLVAMNAYVRGRFLLEEDKYRSSFAWFFVAGISTCLATFSKENGILAIPLCAFLELAVFLPRTSGSRRRVSILVVLLGLGGPALAALALILTRHPLVFAGYENRPFSLDERLLTEGRVLWDYVGSFLLPNGPRLGLYHDDYVISTSLLEPASTLIAFVAWSAMLIVAWTMRHKIPGLLVGAGIFLIGHSLESSIFPLLIYFEHRNYLPTVGLVLALLSVASFLFAKIEHKLDHPRQIVTGTSVLLVVVLAASTWARAGVWGSQETMLRQGERFHPTSRWMHMDNIRYRLMTKPPDYDAARRHIDVLEASTDESAIRAGATWGLMWSCLQDLPVRPDDYELAFGGTAQVIEADLLSLYEAWGTLVTSKPCPELSPLRAAEGLSALVEHSTVPPQNKNLRRLRYKAATLYLAANKPQAARYQAERAYTGRAEDAPIAGLLILLDVADGDFASASARLDYLHDQIKEFDTANRQMIAVLENHLAEARKASSGSKNSTSIR